MKQVRLIGIAGISCSGKSTLVKQLEADGLGKRVRTDAYYKNAQDCPSAHGRKNWELPESLHVDDFVADLTRIKAGKKTIVPLYDRTVSQRVGSRQFVPDTHVFVEGMLLFALPNARQLLDRTIWIDLSFEEMLRRRKKRQPSYDTAYHTRIFLPAMRTHVLPAKVHADVVVDGHQPKARLYRRVRKLITQNTP